MTTIKNAVDDLFNSPDLSAEEAVDRHYAPDFRQCTNGIWDDRHEFLARVINIREIIEQVKVTVLDEIKDGKLYAERHLLDLVHRDGERTSQEVFVFAERDSAGRFVRIEEATREIPE